MKRDVSLDEISDGRLYGLNDMVKADCHECRGCSVCCHGMGESIILDPLDISRLSWNLETTFEQLLEQEKIELHVVDGIILPNLKMRHDTDRCVFLNGENRCDIHAIRPGICRLFPLGRYYEDRGFQYFLQIHECPNPSRTKIKVRKWIDMPDVKRYDAFVCQWHYFLADVEAYLEEVGDDEAKKWNLFLLEKFYQMPFAKEKDFYIQFEERLSLGRKKLEERRAESDV